MRLSAQRSGFFVSEFLLYMVLTACTALFLMRYLYATAMQLRATTRDTGRIATMYAAVDALCHDLEQAPRTVQDWRTLNRDEVAWQQGAERIGWYKEGSLLKRSTQHYAVKHEQWKRSVSHVALDEVTDFACVPHCDENKKSIVACSVKLVGRLKTGGVHVCARTVLIG